MGTQGPRTGPDDPQSQLGHGSLRVRWKRVRPCYRGRADGFASGPHRTAGGEEARRCNPLATRQLGRTNVRVTQLGLGGASIGSPSGEMGPRGRCARHGPPGLGRGTAPVRPHPGTGADLSELRMGAGLRDVPRDEYILSTKVGRWLRRPGRRGELRPGAVGRWQVSRSSSTTRTTGSCARTEQSLQRLGLSRRTTSRSSTTSTSAYHRNEPAVAAYEAQLLGVGLAGARRVAPVRPDQGHRRRSQREGDAAPLARSAPTSTSSSSPCPTRSSTRRSWTPIPGDQERGMGVIIGAVSSGSSRPARSKVQRTPTGRRRPRSRRRPPGSRPSAIATTSPWRRPRCSSRLVTRRWRR